ncbi:Diacylglycerol pyrophosphate phosphatase 1 [Candida viswanathii]|uniref:Diacylglycerol pyrophosphate phosphatase 1 n=1 Tax=Candida viswanathii TaxID=5486 RepID=A0A367YEG8_9ASCO|nr:Diacylglycerol pyrophosphate phosphatase 1 [Candida viswanathii]
MTFITPSSIAKYMLSTQFRQFLPDWIVSALLLAFFFLVAENALPFQRQFSLDDLTISHPFAVQERVTGVQCVLLATLIPLFTILVVLLVRYRAGSLNSQHQAVHVLLISVLGLLVSMSLNGVVTDILKVWIARPRPDFLARCGPKPGTTLNMLVDSSVCTAPLGEDVLIDGMRSTPSGHSSISFSGLLYLTLWLLGQFKLLQARSSPRHVYKYLLVFSPVVLASYVALSRTQDYRHHFGDIIMGSLIGLGFAWWAYHHYFNALVSEESDKPVLDESNAELLLPR